MNTFYIVVYTRSTSTSAVTTSSNVNERLSAETVRSFPLASAAVAYVMLSSRSVTVNLSRSLPDQLMQGSACPLPFASTQPTSTVTASNLST